MLLFAVPGAFTPTCSEQHLPGYVEHAGALKAKGVEAIACFSVNDAFVMGAWGEASKAGGNVEMFADGSAVFTRALGLELDLTAAGMGLRSKRFAMLVEDNTVRQLRIDEKGLDASSRRSRPSKPSKPSKPHPPGRGPPQLKRHPPRRGRKPQAAGRKPQAAGLRP